MHYIFYQYNDEMLLINGCGKSQKILILNISKMLTNLLCVTTAALPLHTLCVGHQVLVYQGGIKTA